MEHLPSDTSHTSPFDSIRHIDEDGNEYWSARELYKILGYAEWRNFNNIVIKRAMKACEENRRAVSDHFVRSYKMVTLGSGSERKTSVNNLHCSRTKAKRTRKHNRFSPSLSYM